MRIGIFVIMAGRNAGGPETYEHHLVRQLAALDAENRYTVFCFSRRAVESFQVTQPNFHFVVLPFRFRPLSMSVSLPWLLKAHRIDLLHSTLMPPLYSPVDQIFTLHCSSMFVCPEVYPRLVRWRLKALTYAGMRQSRHILCVSQNVLDLAAEHYRVPRERMSVVYNGVGAHFKPVAAEDRQRLLERLGIHGPYLLFTGRIEPRKNVVRILEAFQLFRQQGHQDVKLVLAGNKTWAKTEVESTVQRLRLAPHLVFPGHVANQDLPTLYSGAEMLVFPSLWEGFGLPVVEAMACGTSVVTSNLSSLPEIAGEAAVYVDPHSVEDIAAGMQRIQQDRQLAESLRELGFERARRFSWRTNAETTLALYRRLGS